MERISLPGVRKIWYALCCDLPANIISRARAEIPVYIQEKKREIRIIGEARCKNSTDADHNAHIEKAELEFKTLDILPDNAPLAFIIEFTNGEGYIIGTHERPYPIVKITKDSGTASGEASVISYEVSLTARKALIPVVL